MADKPLYPIFLNLANRPILIVGGGAVAARKTPPLLHAGAKVVVVSPGFHSDLLALPISRIAEYYANNHMLQEPWFLVFAATNDPAVNAQVAEDAGERGILFSRADLPDSSSFVNGASIDVGSVTLAVSTGKSSPVLAARIRDAAVAAIDPVLLQWTDLMSGWRPLVLARIADPKTRRDLLLRLTSPEMEQHLRLSVSAAQLAFDSWLAAAPSNSAGDSPHGS